MIQTEESKLEFSSGLSSGAVLPFALRFFEKTDLQVYVTSGGVATLLSQDVDYTIADSSSYEHGANVTLQINPSSGAVVTVKRVLPVTQGLELPNHGKLPTESLEAQLDHATMVQQQHTEELARAFKVPVGDSRTASELIQQMISSGGGGGGGGSSYNFNPVEFTVSSGGSVSINQINKNKITGLSSALEDKQDKLVSGSLYNINVDSARHATNAAGLDAGVVVEMAISAGYHGPFAAYLNEGLVNVASGYVNAGGSSYLIEGATDVVVPQWGGVCYLTLSSGNGSISSGFTADPSNVPQDTVVVRIAERSDDTLTQLQYGDITTVPWGLGGGGGMMFPNYGGLTTAARMNVYSSGEPYSTPTNLDFDEVYYAMDNGFLRISLKNANKTGCLRVDIGASTIELADVRSSTDSSGIAGLTFPDIAIPGGVAFRVYDGINGATPPGDVLIKFDHSVSLTALNNNN